MTRESFWSTELLLLNRHRNTNFEGLSAVRRSFRQLRFSTSLRRVACKRRLMALARVMPRETSPGATLSSERWLSRPKTRRSKIQISDHGAAIRPDRSWWALLNSLFGCAIGAHRRESNYFQIKIIFKSTLGCPVFAARNSLLLAAGWIPVTGKRSTNGNLPVRWVICSKFQFSSLGIARAGLKAESPRKLFWAFELQTK